MAIDPVTALLNVGDTLINRLFPDPEKAADAKLELFKMQQTGELAQLAAETTIAQGQIEINKIEAGSSSKFVTWPRPFILWVCGVAFAYHFVLLPLMAFVYSNYEHSEAILPDFDMEALNTVLFGMLGLGAMRTVDKALGTASSYTKGTKLPWRR